jgi:hypothetical protein
MKYKEALARGWKQVFGPELSPDQELVEVRPPEVPSGTKLPRMSPERKLKFEEELAEMAALPVEELSALLGGLPMETTSRLLDWLPMETLNKLLKFKTGRSV